MTHKELSTLLAPQISVRPVSRFDQQVVLALILRVRQQFGFPTKLETYDADLRDPVGSYQRSGGVFLVLTQGSEVVGTGGVVPTGDGVIELKRFYLAPEVRGLGHGERLLRALLNEARLLGGTCLELDSHSKFEAAAGLYRKLGFTLIERRPRHVAADQVFSLTF